MEHCRECNSTLKADEKECWGCGSAVPEKNPKTTYNERIRGAVKGIFFVFLALTVASLFISYLSVTKCAAGLIVMYFVKSSADHMAEAKKG